MAKKKTNKDYEPLNKKSIDDTTEAEDLLEAGFPETPEDVSDEQIMSEISAEDIPDADPLESVATEEVESNTEVDPSIKDTNNEETATPIVLKCSRCGEEVIEEPICPVCGNPLKLVGTATTKDLVNDASDEEIFSTDDEDPHATDFADITHGEDIYSGLINYEDTRDIDPYE